MVSFQVGNTDPDHEFLIMEVLWFKRMFGLIFICFCAISNVLAVEEIVVVHAPDSIKFLSSEPIHSSFLGDILSAMLAYTIRSNIDWHSLAVVPPWKRPEAIVVLELFGFNNKVDMPIEGIHFLLENAGDIAGQFDLLSYRTEERFLGKRPVLLHMDLGGELYDSKVVQPLLLKAIPADPKKRLKSAMTDPEISDLIKKSTFNTSVPSEIKLLTEFATVREFLKSLRVHKSEVHDKVPDVYWLKMRGLEPIVKTYGTDSLQFQEAVRLLRLIISEVESTMRNVYEDNVIFAVMKVDDMPTPYSYQNRRLLEDAQEEVTVTAVDYNLARKWDSQFPVTFILIAFVSIGLILTILGVSVAMWHMDPGKDSIIYRATQRMKKD